MLPEGYFLCLIGKETEEAPKQALSESYFA